MRTWISLTTGLTKPCAGTGENMGPKRALWANWWSDISQTSAAAPTRALAVDRKGETTPGSVGKLARVSSFAHGTAVWTLAGFRAIEAVRAGDKVLTQDVSTGALSFAPVLTTHHVARDAVKSVTFGDAPVLATGLERFWVPGRGWVKVRELKAGDVVRVLGAVDRIDAIEDASCAARRSD